MSAIPIWNFPFLLTAAVVVLGAWVLSAVILRAACDLCSVEPPGILKAMLLVLLNSVLTSPIGYGIGLLTGRIANSRLGAEGVLIPAIALNLLLSGLIVTIIYMIALRVHLLKAALIWFFQTCVNTLVAAVIIFIAIGAWTIVEGIIRVIKKA
jgi:hypothetical protein